MEDKVVFEEYGIEFNSSEFESEDTETLKRCREKIKNLINILKKGDEK